MLVISNHSPDWSLNFTPHSAINIPNHTGDKEIGLPLRGRPILLITRIIIVAFAAARAGITQRSPLRDSGPSGCEGD